MSYRQEPIPSVIQHLYLEHSMFAVNKHVILIIVASDTASQLLVQRELVLIIAKGAVAS